MHPLLPRDSSNNCSLQDRKESLSSRTLPFLLPFFPPAGLPPSHFVLDVSHILSPSFFFYSVFNFLCSVSNEIIGAIHRPDTDADNHMQKEADWFGATACCCCCCSRHHCCHYSPLRGHSTTIYHISNQHAHSHTHRRLRTCIICLHRSLFSVGFCPFVSFFFLLFILSCRQCFPASCPLEGTIETTTINAEFKHQVKST